MPDKITPSVFIISLPEAEKRRTYIKNVLDKLGLSFEFIDAVDGRNFDVMSHPLYNAPKRLRCFGKNLTGGDLGCILSHKKIYKRMVDNNISHALILEDDVLLRDDFLPVLDKILLSNISYDAIRFFGSPKLERLKMRPILPLDNTHMLTRHSGMPGGSHATLMTFSGAQKMLQHLNHIHLPIDAILGRSWVTKINWYTVRPGIAAQESSFESYIGDERFDRKKDITGFTKLIFPFTRAWFKFCETLGKKYWYYINYFNDKKLTKKWKDTPHG